MRYEGKPQREARLALLLDAAASGLMGVLLVSFAGALAGPLGLSVGLLRGAGLVLLPYVTALGVTASAPTVRSLSAIIACNIVWVAASLALLASGWAAPTSLGAAFILAQAAAVAVFAALQLRALRSLRPGLAT